MFLSNLSISRPVLATMMSAIIIVFGLFSLPRLGIENLPNIDFPVITVFIGLPGADAQTVADQIIEPMERAVNGINGLEKIDSTAFAGAGQLVLRFKLEKKSNEAAQDVRDKVFAALGDLPSEAKTPVIEKVNIGQESVMDLSLSSKTLSIGDLSQLSKDIIQPRLQRVDGVARVDALGQRLREVHVLLERSRLSSYGISVGDVMNSIRSQVIDIPSGKIETENSYFPVHVATTLHSAEEVENLPITSSRVSGDANASQLQIKNVAQVKDAVEFEETSSFYNGNSTILFSVYKQSGANTTAIADSVTEAIARLKKELPAAADLNIVSDNSRFIRASIEGVELDLLLGAILAILTVLLFLRNIRATIISAVALPTAVIGTFAFLNFMGFTLNFMSMLGLSLSIGLLIDDAIVVIENIYRHLHMGKSAKEAARDATAEIGLAVIATTMTICAVFVPVAFMEGIIGRFFYQFGLTVAVSVLISLFVAFTLTPMLSSRLLSEQDEKKRSRVSRAFEHGFERVENSYRRILGFCLRHTGMTVFSGLLIFILSFFLLKYVPVRFFSEQDQGQFSVSLKLEENTSLAVTKSEALALSARIQRYPGVKSVITSIGTGNDRSPNTARLNINLVSSGERAFSQLNMITRLRSDLGRDYKKPKYELTVGQPSMQFILQSANIADLEKFSEDVSHYLEKDIGAFDVTTSKAKLRTEMALLPRLTQAGDLGITPSVAAAQARTMFEGEKVGQIQSNDKRYDIRVRLGETDRRSMQDIESVTLRSSRGSEVPLLSAIKVERKEAPSKIERFNGQRQISVSANYDKPDYSDALGKVQTYINKNSPASLKTSLEGEADIFATSIPPMISALLLAILLIYMILCVQYERYLAPFVIMAALPLSFTGAFGALLLASETMTVYTMIGLILLMGIVTKNGILLIDFTLHKMAEGLSVHEALMEAGPVRLRPILMTTFAAGFGMVPIAIGHGEGGEAKASMGIAVIGGLLASTLLTLVVVPCLFSLAERFRIRIKHPFRRTAKAK
jgi:HAE1 family hydrophobic/amphiphilic exporter-1